jgi:hypothetical protein
MPHRVWKHKCRVTPGLVGLATEKCEDCGEDGVYDGWDYSVVEHMCAYARRTGLAPLGPHRELAHLLLDDVLSPCEECQGRGVLDIQGGKSWRECPKCNGARCVRTVSEGAFGERVAMVLAAYPEAASGRQARRVTPS